MPVCMSIMRHVIGVHIIKNLKRLLAQSDSLITIIMVDAANAATAMSGILPRDSEITVNDAVKNALDRVAAQFPRYKEDQPRAGAHRTFAAPDFSSTLATSDSYSGVGIPFMWLDFQCFSPIGYVPSLGDIATRLAHGAPTPITPKTRIAIYVLDKTTAPAPGELKRLDHDVEVTATLLKLANTIENYNNDKTDQNKATMNDLCETLRHVVVDFHYVEPTPVLQSELFAKAFQLLEDVKITEEDRSQSAWETACSFNRVREDNLRASGDPSSAKVHEFMAAKVTFAKGSDYACRTTDTHTKGADNALLVYDKITRSEVVSLVESAKHEFGLRSPLTQITKVILVCQKAGAEVARVRWLVSFLYFRMKNNLLEHSCPVQQLKMKVLPEALLIHELVTALPPLLSYPRDHDGKSPIDTIWVTATSANALWYERRQASKDHNDFGMALDLTPSASMAVAFMDGLYRGEEDRVWPEMMANCKAMTAHQKLDYGPLSGGGFKDRLLEQFKRDTTPPVIEDAEPAEPEIDPDLLERDRKLQELMTIKPVQRSKEDLIEEYYYKHVTTKFDEMVVFLIRPLTKPEWVEEFQKNHFIAQRKGETLWVFDPDLDREPTPQERESVHHAKSFIDPVHFENFCTAFEEMVDVTNGNIVDMLLVSDAKHRQHFGSYVYKHIKKCKEEAQMVITFKESQLSKVVGGTSRTCRGRRNVAEHVSIFSVKALVPHHEPRLFYNLTSCATNVMIQVDLLAEEDVPTCKKETKEAIHTSAGLLRHERTLARDAMVPVVSKEKHMHLWREQFHHTKAKRAIIATPGGGTVLKACLAHGVKALVIAKNDAHMKHLRDYAIEFMLNEKQLKDELSVRIPRQAQGGDFQVGP